MRKLRSQSKASLFFLPIRFFEKLTEHFLSFQDYTVFTVQPGRLQDVEKLPEIKDQMVFDDTFEIESPGATNGIGTEDFVFL